MVNRKLCQFPLFTKIFLLLISLSPFSQSELHWKRGEVVEISLMPRVDGHGRKRLYRRP